MVRFNFTVFALTLGLVGGGCNGVITDATGEGGSGASAPTPEPDVHDLACRGGEPDVGETPLRRLSTEQYRFTVEDLLGAESIGPETLRDLSLIPDGRVGYFSSSTQAPDAETVRAYLILAEGIAARAASGIECADGDDACLRGYFGRLVRRAFRRPLEDIDPSLEEEYFALFAEERAATDEVTARAALLTAVLASPHFLYHAEIAGEGSGDGALVPLDGYSVAARLSFLLWASGPDEALLDAARAGELASAEGVEARARLMLDDPRTRRGIRSFHEQWLRLDEVEGIIRDDPQWREGMAEALKEETLRFAEHAILDGAGTLEELLTASYSFPGEGVADLYGVSPAAAPHGRVELDPAERAGLLTQPALLAQFGTIFPEVHRGLFIREQLLCDGPPPPPPGVANLPVEDRTATAPCASCHWAMDPIGVGFAGYDALGRFDPTATRGGELRDETGRFEGSAVVGEFDSVPELAERLAKSPEVERCMTVQWVRYATGRNVTLADACGIDELAARFRASGGDIRELLVAIAASPGFRSRTRTELGQ